MVRKRSQQRSPNLFKRVGKKHLTPWGERVSPRQLSKWGSLGGRPKKYASNAEKQRAYKLRKKQTKLGNVSQRSKETQLRPYRSYGEVKIDRYIVCPWCGKIDWDLKQYFNEKGEYISETWWWDSVRGRKYNIRENTYCCPSCSHVFSFLGGEIRVGEKRSEIKRAGSSLERSQRRRKALD